VIVITEALCVRKLGSRALFFVKPALLGYKVFMLKKMNWLFLFMCLVFSSCSKKQKVLQDSGSDKASELLPESFFEGKIEVEIKESFHDGINFEFNSRDESDFNSQSTESLLDREVEYSYTLVTDLGERIAISFEDLNGDFEVESENKYRIHGELVDGKIITKSSYISLFNRGVSLQSDPDKIWKLALVKINFLDEEAVCDAQEIRNLAYNSFQSIQQFVKDVSEDRVNFKTENISVIENITIPIGIAGEETCNLGLWRSEILKKLPNVENDHDRVLYLLPRTAPCWWAGLATGKYVWTRACSYYVANHEILHSFGMSHASSRNADGSKATYGSRADVMGGWTPISKEPNAPHREAASWIGEGVEQLNFNLETFTKVGNRFEKVFYLTPLSLSPAETRNIGCPTGDIPCFKAVSFKRSKEAFSKYFLEYRAPLAPYDFDIIQSFSDPLHINSLTKPFEGTKPDSIFEGSLVLENEAFIDNESGVLITLLEKQSNWLKVKISVEDTCVLNEASFSTFNKFYNTAAGEQFAFLTTLQNNNTGNCNPEIYQISAERLPEGITLNSEEADSFLENGRKTNFVLKFDVDKKYSGPSNFTTDIAAEDLSGRKVTFPVDVTVLDIAYKVSNPEFSFFEGQALKFFVTLTKPSEVDELFKYYVVHRSGSLPADYYFPNSEFKIKAGELSAEVNVPVLIDNDFEEGDEFLGIGVNSRNFSRFLKSLSGRNTANFRTQEFNGEFLQFNKMQPLPASNQMLLSWPVDKDLIGEKFVIESTKDLTSGVWLKEKVYELKSLPFLGVKVDSLDSLKFYRVYKTKATKK